MKLWTIQPIELYKQMLKTGYYRCNEDFVDKDFKNAYLWLIEKMTQKIGPAPEGVKFPVWAWHTRKWKHKKPDLRNTDYGVSGTRMVCIEIEIPNNQVVLTDFDNWHFVLNDWYLNLKCYNEDIWDKDHKWLDSLSEEDKTKEIQKSWDGIFDVEPYENDWICKGKWVQATFWELRKENIVAVREFTVR